MGENTYKVFIWQEINVEYVSNWTAKNKTKNPPQFKNEQGLDVVAHTCSPSYTGGRGKSITVW
jgi:hypothetical protein